MINFGNFCNFLYIFVRCILYCQSWVQKALVGVCMLGVLLICVWNICAYCYEHLTIVHIHVACIQGLNFHTNQTLSDLIWRSWQCRYGSWKTTNQGPRVMLWWPSTEFFIPRTDQKWYYQLEMSILPTNEYAINEHACLFIIIKTQTCTCIAIDIIIISYINLSDMQYTLCR